eukprot:tig00021167_g19064.t1
MIEASVVIDKDLDVVDADWQASANSVTLTAPPEKLRGMPIRDFIPSFSLEALLGHSQSLTVKNQAGEEVVALVACSETSRPAAEAAESEAAPKAYRVTVKVMQGAPRGDAGAVAPQKALEPAYHHQLRLGRNGSISKSAQWLAGSANGVPVTSGVADREEAGPDLRSLSKPAPAQPQPAAANAAKITSSGSLASNSRKRSVQMDGRPQEKVFGLTHRTAPGSDAASDKRDNDDGDEAGPQSRRKTSVAGSDAVGKSAKWARKLARLKRRIAAHAGENASIKRMQLTIRAVVIILVAMAIACYIAMVR